MLEIFQLKLYSTQITFNKLILQYRDVHYDDRRLIQELWDTIRDKWFLLKFVKFFREIQIADLVSESRESLSFVDKFRKEKIQLENKFQLDYSYILL